MTSVGIMTTFAPAFGFYLLCGGPALPRYKMARGGGGRGRVRGVRGRFWAWTRRPPASRGGTPQHSLQQRNTQ